MSFKTVLREIPIVGPAARWAKRQLRGNALEMKPPAIPFTSSDAYWTSRYTVGGNSGSGSYGRLAQFKAEFLNALVKRLGVTSIIEFGSGDGAQLALAEYPAYIGVDVATPVVERARATFAGQPSFKFLHTSEVPADLRADMTMSLDVIYHLVEDEVFERYMAQLCDSAGKYVVVYSSNHAAPGPAPHVRHRKFSDWIDVNRPDLRLVEHTPNPYPADPADPQNTSFADFYVYARS